MSHDNNVTDNTTSLDDVVVPRVTNSPFTVMLETDDDSARSTTNVDNEEEDSPTRTSPGPVDGNSSPTQSSSAAEDVHRTPTRQSSAVVDSDRSPVVHVDEGSTHGTTSLFDDEELAQLTSRKINLFGN